MVLCRTESVRRMLHCDCRESDLLPDLREGDLTSLGNSDGTGFLMSFSLRYTEDFDPVLLLFQK